MVVPPSVKRRSASAHELRQRTIATTPAQVLLGELISHSLVLSEDWEAQPEEVQARIKACLDRESLLQRLVEARLLTEYQAERIRNGKMHGLVLGNYRVLEKLGSGGMGVVFRGEHIRMRRQVALKVMPTFTNGDDAERALTRFYAEVRAVAQLQHPNVVQALDAGEVPSPDGDTAVLHYYVMEYVEGVDLEEHVRRNGPLPVSQACDLIYQVASALAEAHARHLIHRDIKPANILLTPEQQVKLLDFGLVRHFRHRMTEPGTVLGTLDYISPEQASDASTVDGRTDIFGLGGTLYYLLTGQPPFEPKTDLLKELASRQEQPPPSARIWNPDVPEELDRVLATMMAVRKEERYATAQDLMRAMIPFLSAGARDRALRPLLAERPAATPAKNGVAAALPAEHGRALIVDDDPAIRQLCRYALEKVGISCDEAPDGWQALARLTTPDHDLVLLDWGLPDLSGGEVCRRIRQARPSSDLKIVLVSGGVPADALAEQLFFGADDCLSKPFNVSTLVVRSQALLQLKRTQEQCERLSNHLRGVNTELEQRLNSSQVQLTASRRAVAAMFARLAGLRDVTSPGHIIRMQRYVQRLAEEAMALPAFAGERDPSWIHELECAAPLHDLGRIALPDALLAKEGRLEPHERIIMQTHTVIGADILLEAFKAHGDAVAYLKTAAEIARHHHERWDGTGYPDGLAGDRIPLSARIVTVADVYDVLRSRRSWKPALSHAAAWQTIFEASPGQFDPHLLQALRRCAADFERIYRDIPD